MPTAQDYGLKVGSTYNSRKGSPSPAREVIHISANGATVQYDGAAVADGRHFPTTTAEAFAKWAGIAKST